MTCGVGCGTWRKYALTPTLSRKRERGQSRLREGRPAFHLSRLRERSRGRPRGNGVGVDFSPVRHGRSQTPPKKRHSDSISASALHCPKSGAQLTACGIPGAGGHGGWVSRKAFAHVVRDRRRVDSCTVESTPIAPDTRCVSDQLNASRSRVDLMSSPTRGGSRLSRTHVAVEPIPYRTRPAVCLGSVERISQSSRFHVVPDTRWVSAQSSACRVKPPTFRA